MEYMSVDKYIKVKDDWYPCFDYNRIVVILKYFYDEITKNYTVLISAYGKDDYCVELRHEAQNAIAALDIFLLWKKHIFDRIPDGITVEWFYEHGFIPG